MQIHPRCVLCTVVSRYDPTPHTPYSLSSLYRAYAPTINYAILRMLLFIAPRVPALQVPGGRAFGYPKQ